MQNDLSDTLANIEESEQQNQNSLARFNEDEYKKYKNYKTLYEMNS